MKVSVPWKNYGLETVPDNGDQLLTGIARKRGYLLPGGRLDTERAAYSFIRDFRDKKLGRLTLEWPPSLKAP